VNFVNPQYIIKIRRNYQQLHHSENR